MACRVNVSTFGGAAPFVNLGILAAYAIVPSLFDEPACRDPELWSQWLNVFRMDSNEADGGFWNGACVRRSCVEAQPRVDRPCNVYKSA